MVSFTPTDEQRMLVDAIRRYAHADMRKIAHEADEASHIPQYVIDTGWEMGLIPAALPEEYGGFGEREALTGVLAAEELAYGDLTVAMKLLTPALFAYPVLMFGTEEQKQAYLPRFAEEFTPYTAALMEPGVFFDPGNMVTVARAASGSASNGTIRLNGQKAYVPLAADAPALLVYARDAESGAVGGYIVPSDVEGLTVGERDKLMGVRGLETYPVTLSDVKLDAGSKLGGEAGIDFQQIRNYSHVALAALATGVARASYEYALQYAKERVQFGVPIASKQAIAFMLAECAIEVDAARLMAWEAAWKLDAGQDATAEAYLAKEYAAKAVLFVTDSGVQTLGGHGFIREHPVERWLRNARGFAMFDGLATV
ncbi:MAG: acyl-CoA dehydrogenase family protein [Anaerolineae bacterium]|nr:acyl-CoA dehydrogenase family protein [Anaerolineae bacterium]